MEKKQIIPGGDDMANSSKPVSSRVSMRCRPERDLIATLPAVFGPTPAGTSRPR
jgi:hypothetical protein